MDYRVCKFKLAIFSLFLVMNPKIECLPGRQTPRPPLAPIRPTPLCDAQIAVASSACSMMPFSTIPPPTPLSLDSPSPSPESPPPPLHRHRHRHRTRGHSQTPVERECCHWVRAIDSVCVCNLLVYLPVFLSKPAHRYTVITDPSCNVAYTCPGRLMLV